MSNEFRYQVDPSVTNPDSQPIKTSQLIPVITILLVIANVLVYYYIEVMGSSNDTDFMIKMGAMYEPLFAQGEYYRLFTHFFLHFGFQHLANNMISLLILGYALENVIGKPKFVFIYLCSGVLAGGASLIYNSIQGVAVVSCGASGAIFGLMGALLAVLIFRPRRGFSTEAPRLLIYIALSVYSGMQDTTIDNAAHIGGCVAGFIICMFFILVARSRNKAY